MRRPSATRTFPRLTERGVATWTRAVPLVIACFGESARRRSAQSLVASVVNATSGVGRLAPKERAGA